jgi:dihydrofolate reductase
MSRKIIVNAGTSADGFIARPDGDIDWLTSRPKLPGKNIWMMGGGGAIGSFLDAGAIDELIITVAPVLIGEGIPLIAPRHRHGELKLLGSKQFDDGVVQLHYAVQRA